MGNLQAVGGRLMISKKFLFSLFYITAIACYAGCSSKSTQSITETTPSSTNPMITGVAQTDIPTFTPFPSPIPTSTLLPTLSTGDAFKYMENLMKNSDNCQLPCWMGISPGQSIMDIRTQFTILSSVTKQSLFGVNTNDWVIGGAIILFPRKDVTFEIVNNYLSKIGDGNISVIAFSTRSYSEESDLASGDVYGNLDYLEVFSQYTVSRILSKYGEPDQIYILGSLRNDKLPETPGWGDDFVLYLWYPSKGIFLNYQMAVSGSGDNYRFCPSDAFISGNLMKGDPGSGYKDILMRLGETYQHILSGSPYIKTPQDAFDMTNEDFYKLFSVPTNRCLETPKSIWWPK
jgi:hypothetical protein